VNAVRFSVANTCSVVSYCLYWVLGWNDMASAEQLAQPIWGVIGRLMGKSTRGQSTGRQNDVYNLPYNNVNICIFLQLLYIVSFHELTVWELVCPEDVQQPFQMEITVSVLMVLCIVFFFTSSSDVYIV